MSEKPLATMKSAAAKRERVEQGEDEGPGVVDRGAEVRRPPVPGHARQGIGDHDHVEQREHNERSGGGQWHGLRERELSNPVGHPVVTVSRDEGAFRRDVRPRFPTGREA